VTSTPSWPSRHGPYGRALFLEPVNDQPEVASITTPAPDLFPRRSRRSPTGRSRTRHGLNVAPERCCARSPTVDDEFDPDILSIRTGLLLFTRAKWEAPLLHRIRSGARMGRSPLRRYGRTWLAMSFGRVWSLKDHEDNKPR
jgi:hypothetical protein